jgi:hypothetical protein
MASGAPGWRRSAHRVAEEEPEGVGDGGAEHGVAEPLVGLHRPRRPRRDHLEEKPGERDEAEAVARVPKPPAAEQRPGEKDGREDQGDNDREDRQRPSATPTPWRPPDAPTGGASLSTWSAREMRASGAFADDPAATPMVTEALR